MISPKQLSGTGVALITPFNQQKEVDHPALKNLVNNVIDNGIGFLVALGTTAETATLSSKEKLEVVRSIKEANAGRIPIVLGMGDNNTAQLIETINRTDFDGIDAILTVTPFYNKPNQKGLYQHYKAVSEVSPVPVILYNVPSRTGCNLNAQTTIRLANDFDNIIAVKEASGKQEQIMDLIKYKPDNFLVLSGDDLGTLPLIALGGDGVISVIANAFPSEFSTLVNAAKEHDLPLARQIHYSLTDIINNIFAEGNPAGIKAILHLQQIIDNQVRLPLVPVTDKLYGQLKSQIAAL
ncbi:4-hydroxy-tetrahydrodipicolinate synthase [Carboxylicivirga sp. RSCT41]|uniref:4-hydroxy-tetrahydrodipicolinate synthase n=1 Tax=Carboxylicivirga agarovorans TaxID=3417570 RepID=UPI003D350561